MLPTDSNLTTVEHSLKKELLSIIKESRGTIGIGFKDFSTEKETYFNNDIHFPMQSVYKLPLAMAVLKQVDLGNLALNQKLILTKRDLLPHTWSPLREKYVERDTSVSLEEILTYTISQSDNNGCDILFRLLGGTEKVNSYVHDLGIEEIYIVATEEEMHNSNELQYQNWAKPSAFIKLLEMLHKSTALSASCNDFLLRIMRETTTGANRIKGLLPEGSIVAHKTGTSDTNSSGVTSAVNDVGMVTLPDGRVFGLVVFVKDTADSIEISEGVIARVSRVFCDHLQN